MRAATTTFQRTTAGALPTMMGAVHLPVAPQQRPMVGAATSVAAAPQQRPTIGAVLAAALQTTHPSVDERKPPAIALPIRTAATTTCQSSGTAMATPPTVNTSLASATVATVAAAAASSQGARYSSNAPVPKSAKAAAPSAKKPDYYQRQNMEIESLRQQVQALQLRNQAIREDNRRLDAMLNHAQLLIPSFVDVPQQQEQDEQQEAARPTMAPAAEAFSYYPPVSPQHEHKDDSADKAHDST